LAVPSWATSSMRTHRMHGDEALLHALELGLEALLARIHHYPAAFAEHQLLDLDEPPEAVLAHLTGIHLVELALVS